MSENVSVYRGISPEVIATVPWQQAVGAIQTEKYKEKVIYLRDIKDAEQYRKEKCNLISVTFGGTFNGKRNRDTIKDPSGFIVADIDHCADVQGVFNHLKNDEHIWFAFISPGGDGIKCGLRSKTVTSDADHKQFFRAVEKYFKDVYDIKIDQACKDISRLTFVSWDPGAHINTDASYFDHSQFVEEPPPPKPTQPKTDIDPRKQKYGDKVLAGKCENIANSAPGEQHKARIDNAHHVGGLIPTGYIDHGHAVIALERAVVTSGAKNLKAAFKDIADGLKSGEAKPLDPIGENDIPYMVGEARPTQHDECPAPTDDDAPPEQEQVFQINQLASAILKASTESQVLPGNELTSISLENIFTEKIEERPIFKDFINEDDQTVIYAPGGVGKSLMVQDMLMTLASDQKWLWEKFEVEKPRLSLIIQSEVSRNPAHQRVIKKCEGRSSFLDGLANVHYLARHNNIMVAGNVSAEAFRTEIVEYTKRLEDELNGKIDIIAWDPLISYHDAEENDNSRMRTTLDCINEVGNQIKASTWVIHHANKTGGLRGASAIFDWARNIIKLEDTLYKGQKQIKVIHEKCNNAKMLDPFHLAIDEYLNFSHIEFASDLMSQEFLDRCLKVKKSLEILGGTSETKAALITQYKEMTGMKSDAAIHKHIDLAVENDFIKREYWLVGNTKRARFYV